MGHVSGKYTKKLLKETEVEDALQRLQKLSMKESHIRSTQVLKAVHELMQFLKATMGGRRATK